MKLEIRQNRLPVIYAYTLPSWQNRAWTSREGGNKGWLKVGYTTRTAIERIDNQVKLPEKAILLHEEDAITESGHYFTDHAVHRVLEERGARRLEGEWFEAELDEVKTAIATVKAGRRIDTPDNFAMRPEQREAVKKTAAWFRAQKDPRDRHFLWNAKMRFGKTFAAYQLAKEMGWKRLLILTYKPAVQDAWQADLTRHGDFVDWQFIGGRERFEDQDESRPIAWLISFQKLMQRRGGEIDERLELAYAETWDCIILDEYHFGAWRERARDLFDDNRKEAMPDDFKADCLPLSGRHWLYLSGTPFRALAEGEFTEEQIFNWTYADEQQAKQAWRGDDNPYAEMPEMVLVTYQLPEQVARLAATSLDDEFSLNQFFAADETEDGHAFCQPDNVGAWLSWLRGQLLTADKPELLPYHSASLRGALQHTVWLLPTVAACHAMKAMLDDDPRWRQDFQVIAAAGAGAGVGVKALKPVRRAIGDGMKGGTITLTCGKLTTGVTVPQWGAVFMLRDTSTPELYYQAAFRAASPWSLPNAANIMQREILKKQAYIFDFAPNRALRLIADYCSRLAGERSTPEAEIERFLNFLPVLCHDGAGLKALDAREVMDMAVCGTGAAMLARRWQAASMVTLDKNTLGALLRDDELLKSLANIEAFRQLRDYAERIVNADDRIKQAKREQRELEPEEKRERDEAKNKRKEIQERLLQFLCRVPVFMYLTDEREEALRDIIRNLEPELFTTTTGLTIKDFDRLCAAGVFNRQTMNAAIHTFRRQENYSLIYAGGEAPGPGKGF